MKAVRLFLLVWGAFQLGVSQDLYDYAGNVNNLVSFTTQTDIVYGVGAVADGDSSKNLHIDAYVPEGMDSYSKAAILYIHGGGFTQGDKSHERFNAEYFARRGFVTFSMQYRLQGDNPPGDGFTTTIRAAVVDAKAALRWIHANAATYDIHTGNIFIGGTSAGAITALIAGATDDGFYVTDFNDGEIPASNNPGQPMDVYGIIDFCGGMFGQESQIDANDPPLLIYHGTADSTVPFTQAEALRDRAEEVGLTHEFYPIEGGGHCPSQPAENGKNLRELTHEFILKHLQTTSPVELQPGFRKNFLTFTSAEGGVLRLLLHGLQGRNVTLTLYDASGRQLLSQSIKPQSGNQAVALKGVGRVVGAVYLQLKSPEGMQWYRLML